MIEKEERIGELIKELAWHDVDLLHLSRATVLAVDEENNLVKARSTVEPDIIYEANLQSITSSLGILFVPVIGSLVTIGFVNNSEQQAVVLQTSEIEKVLFVARSGIDFKIHDADESIVSISGSQIKIGNTTESAVKGEALQTLIEEILQTLSTIIAWGKTGVAPTGGSSDKGGIAPLDPALQTPVWNSAILSETNKIS